MDSMLGSLVLERSPGLFSIYGELDAATAPQLAELADVQGPLRLDLSGVTFLDSSGIIGLVRLYQRCEHDGCTFRIVDCSPQVNRVLHLVDLYDRLVETNGDASATSRSPTPEMVSGTAAQSGDPG
jgi:anti-anti-sigma factor